MVAVFRVAAVGLVLRAVVPACRPNPPDAETLGQILGLREPQIYQSVADASGYWRQVIVGSDEQVAKFGSPRFGNWLVNGDLVYWQGEWHRQVAAYYENYAGDLRPDLADVGGDLVMRAEKRRPLSEQTRQDWLAHWKTFLKENHLRGVEPGAGLDSSAPRK